MQVAWMQVLDDGADWLAAMSEYWAMQVAWTHGPDWQAAMNGYWATQVAWMQASMKAQDADYAERSDAGTDGQEIDITGKLTRVSSTGLSQVEKATLKADCLRAQLANVKHTLEHVSDMMDMVETFQFFPYPGGDDLELRAARAFMEVRELLRQQAAQEAPPLPAAAVEDLKLLQLHTADVALLLCSRFISQRILKIKGIAPELLARLIAAFGKEAIDDDDIWARLGNSKYQLHTRGERFNEPRTRRPRGRGPRKSRRAAAWAAAAENETEAGDPVASSSAAGSLAASSAPRR